MKVVAFTGMPGAGKTEAINIARSMDFPVVSMGDKVRAEAQQHCLADNDAAVGSFADGMRQQYGLNIWARRCLEDIKKHSRAVIDGIRNIEEVETFKHEISHFILVAIHASPQTRYKRLMQRKRADDSLSVEDLKKREQRELSWGIGDVIAMADIVVANENDLGELREKIKRILASLFE